MKVLVCDPISQTGIDFLKQQDDLKTIVLDRLHTEKELLPIVSDVSAIAIRSETKVTKAILEAAPEMKIVGRAGVGVDNIDIEAATQSGVIVMNTPGGNTIATCELTFSMMTALARNIPQAHVSMMAGEWNRKDFKGVELYGKTLGVMGMGRIGGEVARRAVAFGMRVLAFDPYITPSRAKMLQVELAGLDDIYGTADFITVHMPLTEETRGMLNKDTFARMKPSVRLLNCARGGIVSEHDLLEALKAGQIAGARLRAVGGRLTVAPVPEPHTNPAPRRQYGRGAGQCRPRGGAGHCRLSAAWQPHKLHQHAEPRRTDLSQGSTAFATG